MAGDNSGPGKLIGFAHVHEEPAPRFSGSDLGSHDCSAGAR